MKKYLFTGFLVVMALVLILSGCGQSSPTTTASPSASAPAVSPADPSQTSPGTALTPKYGGTFRLGNETGPAGQICWPPESIGESSRVQQPVLETLIYAHPGSVYKPRLATEWEIAPDRNSITFKLRKGVKFHDGTDFNAQAVKYCYDAVKAQNKSGTAQWVSVDVIDDYTVRINLKGWQNTILGGFGDTASFIFSPAALENHGIEYAREHMIGTGPFKFESFERDVNVKYSRNDNYWDPGKPYLDAMEYIFVADPITVMAMMQTGEMDAVKVAMGKTADDLRSKGLKMFTGILGIYPMIPDSANPDSPYYDVRVRQAVEYAIDKEAIAKSLSYGFWTAAYQWAPEGNVSFDPTIEPRKYNVAKAKELLAEAGYPNGFKTRIIASPNGLEKDALVAVQNYLSKVGIEAELELPEQASYFEMRTTGWKNAILCEPIPVGVNPMSTYLLNLLPANHWYNSMLKTDECLRLLDEALTTLKPEPEQTQALVRYVWENNLIIPLNTFGEAFPMQQYVEDHGFQSMASSMFWRPDTVWLNK